MQTVKGILREVWKIIWMMTRYLLVCLLVTGGMVSLATGKFPPPLKETYENIRSAQESLNLAASTSKIVKAKEEQQKVLNAIDQGGDINANQRSVAQAMPEDSDQQKIRQLEYEVALLKSKLARAQWEFRQLQAQRQPQAQPQPQEAIQQSQSAVQTSQPQPSAQR